MKLLKGILAIVLFSVFTISCNDAKATPSEEVATETVKGSTESKKACCAEKGKDAKECSGEDKKACSADAKSCKGDCKKGSCTDKESCGDKGTKSCGADCKKETKTCESGSKKACCADKNKETSEKTE